MCGRWTLREVPRCSPGPPDRWARGWVLELALRMRTGVLAGMLLASCGLTLGVAQERPQLMGISDTDLFRLGLQDGPISSEPSWIDGALFLSDGRLAALNGSTQRIHFLDSDVVRAIAVGGEGYEPGVVTRLLERLPSGGVATIDADRALVTFRADGSVASSMKVVVGRSMEPVGLFRDGTLVFRVATGTSGPLPADVDSGSDEAIVRQDIEYRTLRSSGQSAMLARALGDETMSVTASRPTGASTRRFRTVFGHATMADVAGDLLVVAQSDAEHVLLYDKSGRVVGRIPMPPRSDYRPTPGDVSAQRNVRLQEHRREARARYQALLSNDRFAPMARRMAQSDSALIWKLAASENLPPIDRMFADASGRLWLRVAPMPKEPMGCWQVWNLDVVALDRTVVIPRSAHLLDARGDRVLLQVASQGALGSSLVIRRMVPLQQVSKTRPRGLFPHSGSVLKST